MAPAIVLAETVQFNAQISIPGSSFQSGQPVTLANDTSLICNYIIAIYKYGIAIIGVLAVIAVAIGGTYWVLAAGNSGRIGEAKAWIFSGLSGLILALSSFLILSTISSQLVTCQIRSIQSLQQITATSTPSYGKAGVKCQEIAKRLDMSGQYYCCVIKGKIDMSGVFKDTAINRCATYESNNQKAAQTECSGFYDNYKVAGTPRSWWVYGTGVIGLGIVSSNGGKLSLEARDPNASPGSLNTASVYAGTCWGNPTVQQWCTCGDDATFCQKHDEGDSCLTPDEQWGYCNASKQCVSCKKHCQACNHNYECPNQLNRPDTDAGIVCGNTQYSWLSSNSNDCSSGICDKEFDGGCK